MSAMAAAYNGSYYGYSGAASNTYCLYIATPSDAGHIPVVNPQSIEPRTRNNTSGWRSSTTLGETGGRNRRALTRCFSSLARNPGRGILPVMCTLQKQVCDCLACLGIACPRWKLENLGRVERVCESD
jgi:hypothetical protein